MNEEDFKRLLAASAEETRRHFDATAERLEKRFHLLAETVDHVDRKIDRVEANLRDEMRSGFAETQAMITDLQARVERLEQSTH